jgi:DNA-binding NarL/FixJ family response regulator
LRNKGADGYIERDNTPELLEKAILSVSKIGTYFSEKLRVKLVPKKLLTSTQLTVYELSGQGKSMKEIGSTMGISNKTVVMHYRGIQQRLIYDNVNQVRVEATIRYFNKNPGKDVWKGISNPNSVLSQTELKTFTMLGNGLGTKEIAMKLSRSPKTVQLTLTRVTDKLGVKGYEKRLMYAVLYANQLGLEYFKNDKA